MDDNIYIGSSNITEDYGGEKYGSGMFLDVNMLMKGYCNESFYRIIENNFLKEMEINPDEFDKELEKRKKMLEKFKEVKKFKNNEYVNKNKYDILISKFPYKNEIQNELYNNIIQSKKKIVFIAPYFYDSIVDFLPIIDAVERGVEVEILTAKNKDISCYSALKNFVLFRVFLNKGIKIYEYPDKYLHGKAALFDDQVLQIGSFNLDGWSYKNNTGRVSLLHLIIRNQF